MSDIVHSFMESPQYRRGAMFVNYDEWGGFFDHVKPPHVPDDRYNRKDLEEDWSLCRFRIPGVAISPFTKGGGVSHMTVTHESILKLIVLPLRAGLPDHRGTATRPTSAARFDFENPDPSRPSCRIRRRSSPRRARSGGASAEGDDGDAAEPHHLTQLETSGLLERLGYEVQPATRRPDLPQPRLDRQRPRSVRLGRRGGVDRAALAAAASSASAISRGQLGRRRPVRRVHLEQQRRAVARAAAARSRSHWSEPRPGGRCRSRRSGSSSAGRWAPSPPGAEVVVDVEQGDRVEHRLTSCRRSVRRRLAVMFAWPMSRQRRERRRADLGGERAQRRRHRRDGLGPGVEGREVLDRDHDPEPLGELGGAAPARRPRQRAGSAMPARRAAPSRGGRSARSRPRPRRRCVASSSAVAGGVAGEQRAGRVQDGAQAGRRERAPDGVRVRDAVAGLRSTAAGGAGTWTQPKPEASISFSIGDVGHHS